jgi:AcrR family transcriptional regulator
MVDVAREAGISAGALYNYVDGKEALLELALAHSFGEIGEQDEPFRGSGLASVGAALAAKLSESLRWPILENALRRSATAHTDMTAVVDELFTFVTQHRYLIWLLDRCGAEIAELGGVYQTAVRGRLFADFTRFVGMTPAGRELDDAELAARARAIFEMVVWMGMHRHRDRQPPAISDETARQAVIAIALSAMQARN